MIYVNETKKTDSKKEHPSAHAFLTNPVASVNEFTGYGSKLPLSEEEADSLSDMFDDVPTEESYLEEKSKCKKDKDLRNTDCLKNKTSSQKI